MIDSMLRYALCCDGLFFLNLNDRLWRNEGCQKVRTKWNRSLPYFCMIKNIPQTTDLIF